MSFDGTSMIVWLADGKMKHRFFDDQAKWKAEVERIRELVPPHHMWLAAVDWNNETMHTFLGNESTVI